MEKRTILASLTNIANELDYNGMYNEANILTDIAESLSRKIVAQYTGPGSTGEYLTKKDRNLDNEITRFKARSERENADPNKKARDEAYQKIINYAKKSLYDRSPGNKFTNQQRIRNANDYVIDEMNRNPLLTDKQKYNLSRQWERLKKEFLESRDVSNLPKLEFEDITEQVKRRPGQKTKTLVTQPSDKLEPSKPTPVQPKDVSTEQEIKSKLYRWINKAENIYKKWDNTPARSRDNNSIMLMLQDISDYLKQMKSFSSRQAKPFVDDAIRKVDNMYAKVLVSFGDMGSTTLFTPEYKDVTGFPKKEKNPFDTDDRLTGTKLKEQAKLEGRSL